jgi:hypothetical protein
MFDNLLNNNENKTNFDFDLTNDQIKKTKTKFDITLIENEKKNKPKIKGGYKAVLIDLESLKNEAEYMEIEISKLVTHWQAGSLTDQDVVSLYIITYLQKRYPNHFLESFNQIIPTEIVNEYNFHSEKLEKFHHLTSRLKETNTFTIFDLINNFNLHCIPKTSRIAIVKWYLKIYDIVPILHVATAEEIIKFQANKQRCVTLPTKNLDKLIEDHRDALSFVIHDLQHAFKMFDNEVLLQGQVAFSILMLKIVSNDLIQNFLTNDEDFQNSFYYLVSDMNSHTKHLFFHFKTCLINAFKKKYYLNQNEHLCGVSLEDFNKSFEQLLDLFEMNEIQKQSARDVLFLDKNNQFNSFDFNILNDFFLNLYNFKFNK